MNDVSSALARARAFSGFLARTIERNPQISGLLESGRVEEAYALAQAAGEGAAGTGQALRWRRNAIALVTAIADLSGAWDLNRVTRTLSDFADTALDEAIATEIGRASCRESVCQYV